MLVALGFAPNNAGFGAARVENNDIDAARIVLQKLHGRDDFVRIIVLESEADIKVVGNWAKPFDLKTATLAQISELMYGEKT